MKIDISEIQILPIKPNNGLVAFASCVLSNSLYLGSIAIHKKLNGAGYRLTYPTKKVGDKNLHLYHPVTKMLSKEIEKAVFAKFKEVMNKTNDRHNYSEHS